MPLNGAILGQLMTAQCASKGLLGQSTPDFCQGFSNGLVSNFLSSNQVVTVDVGVLTSGSGIGTMTGLIPSVLTGLAYPLVMSTGALGENVQDLVDAMSQSICTHFNSMNIVNTTHTTVVLGSGTGKVLGLVPASMASDIMGQLSSKGILGVNIQPFVNSYCTAFCAFVLANAIVQVVISGTPAPLILGVPVPSTGSGKGQVS